MNALTAADDGVGVDELILLRRIVDLDMREPRRVDPDADAERRCKHPIACCWFSVLVVYFYFF